MREIGQGTVPTGEMEKETFLSLRLAEPSERVNITLDERMLSIEGKRSATVDLRLSAITTMRHHSSNLVPTWLILLGMAFVWIGYRVLVPTTYRMISIGMGAGFISARLLTKKPTLTIQTSSGDTHVLYGNERELNRLSFMFNHLANNKSMAEVRAKLAAIEAELGGGWRDTTVPPAPVLPGLLDVPQTVDRFLTEGEPNAVLSAEPEPEWVPTHEPAPQASPQVVGFIPSFQPVVSAPQPSQYPPDHRPSPINRPVLLPEQTPPMYQMTDQEGRPFLPSFFSQDAVHVPGLNTSESQEEEEEAEDSLGLDAELLDVFEASIVSEPERADVQSAPAPQRESSFKPKDRRRIEQTPFRPRRTQQLRPREARGNGLWNRIRETSNDLIRRGTDGSRSRAVATTETSGGLRAQAAASAAEINATRLHDSLSEERGGVLAAAEAERLNQHAQRLLTTANELAQSGENELDAISFSDLRSTTEDDENVHVPRLDDD